MSDLRKATGPIRGLEWKRGWYNLPDVQAKTSVWSAGAPELGEGGHYSLRVAGDGVEAHWSVGRNQHDAYGGNIGQWLYADHGGREVCARIAIAAIEAHFTDVVEKAVARMRGLA